MLKSDNVLSRVNTLKVFVIVGNEATDLKSNQEIGFEVKNQIIYKFVI